MEPDENASVFRVKRFTLSPHNVAEAWKICGWLPKFSDGEKKEETAKKVVDLFLKSDLCLKNYDAVLKKYADINKDKEIKNQTKNKTKEFTENVAELSGICFRYKDGQEVSADEVKEALNNVYSSLGGCYIDEKDIDYDGFSMYFIKGEPYGFKQNHPFQSFLPDNNPLVFKKDVKLLYEWHDWLKEARLMDSKTAVTDPMFISLCNAFRSTIFCSGFPIHCSMEYMFIPGGNFYAAIAYSDLDFVKNWFHKTFWRFGRYKGSAEEVIETGELLLYLNRLKEFADSYPKKPVIKELPDFHEMSEWSEKKREEYDMKLENDPRVKMLLEIDE